MLSLASRRDLVRVGLEPMPNTWQINLPRIIESPLDSETVKFSIPRQYTRRRYEGRVRHTIFEDYWLKFYILFLQTHCVIAIVVNNHGVGD